jgi:hypothetical protein
VSLIFGRAFVFISFYALFMSCPELLLFDVRFYAILRPVVFVVPFVHLLIAFIKFPKVLLVVCLNYLSKSRMSAYSSSFETSNPAIVEDWNKS